MSDIQLTWEAYLAQQPPERRGEIEQVWESVRAHVPTGYSESIGPKYISFGIEGEMYVALANQKSYISLHLLPVYVYPALRAQLDAAAPMLKMGKGCINFKRAAALPLATIGAILSATPAADYLAHMRAVRGKGAK